MSLFEAWYLESIAADGSHVTQPIRKLPFRAMRALAARLETIGVHFAYDDFGAGQARLRELAEVPLAVGIDTEAEAAACRNMGFQRVHGYLTGRPVAISSV